MNLENITIYMDISGGREERSSVATLNGYRNLNPQQCTHRTRYINYNLKQNTLESEVGLDIKCLGRFFLYGLGNNVVIKDIVP